MVYALLACVYIRQTVFERKFTNTENAVAIVITVILAVILGNNILRIPHDEGNVRKKQALEVGNFARNNGKVVVHFDNKPGLWSVMS